MAKASKAKTSNSLIVELAKCFVHPVLADAGFDRRRLRWQRHVQGLIDVIEFQPSAWNDRTGQAFTVNLGVLVPFVYQTCWQSEEPTFPKEVDCTVRRRIGVLAAPAGRVKAHDLWWKIASRSDLDNTASKVLEHLCSYGLPFLARVKSLESVRDCLVEDSSSGSATPADLINLAIVSAQLRDSAGAKRILFDVTDRNPAWRERARAVATKLGVH